MKYSRKIIKQKKYFESIAKGYIRRNLPMISFFEKLKRATTGYPKGDVLVVGSGGLINFDIKNAKSIFLTDITSEILKNPRIIEKGKIRTINNKLMSKTKIMEANVMDLAFSDRSFDTVIMFYIIHHLSAPSLLDSRKNVQRAFSEIYRVLRKNGVLLMDDNCPGLLFKFFQDLMYECLHFFLSKFGKPLPYFLSQDEIINLLQEEGFAIIEEKRIPITGKIYLPIFPHISPPVWLWELFFKNRFIVAEKK